VLGGKLPNNGVFSPPLTWKAQLQWKIQGENGVLKQKMGGKQLACLPSVLVLCFSSLTLHVSFHTPLSSSFKDFWVSQFMNARSASNVSLSES